VWTTDTKNKNRTSGGSMNKPQLEVNAATPNSSEYSNAVTQQRALPAATYFRKGSNSNKKNIDMATFINQKLKYLVLTKHGVREI
jgi:hypothetical protein